MNIQNIKQFNQKIRKKKNIIIGLVVGGFLTYCGFLSLNQFLESLFK